jgi:NADPH-dependent ferric siderophore reductase
MQAEAAQTTLRAWMKVRLIDPRAVMGSICASLGEFGKVDAGEMSAQVTIYYGTVALAASTDILHVEAEGADPTALAYVKMSVAEHLLRAAGREKPVLMWEGHGAAGEPLPDFREMRVVGAWNITPRMRRIRLSGPDLARFASGGLHVRLLIPPRKDLKPQWPVSGADGRLQWPPHEHRPLVRIYTIRHIDVARGELDIDVVIHEGDDTPGSSWAKTAQAGDVVGVMGPGGGGVPDAQWYLLAGDETALPAISRILASLPARCRATAIIEVADESERQPLSSQAEVDIRWLYRKGAEPGTTTLIEDAVRSVPLPDADVQRFVWAGCEHKSCRCLRKLLRQERGLPTTDHLVMAYWRAGRAGDEAGA